MLYKIHNSLVAMNIRNYLAPAGRVTRNTHHLAYQIPECRTEYQRQSFFPRTVQEWNSLPAAVVTATTLDAFRSRLARADPAGDSH